MRAVLLIVLLLLSACTVIEKERPEPFYEFNSEEAPRAVAKSSSPAPVVTLIATRDYWTRDDKISIYPFNFVYFPRRPIDDKEQEQYRRICSYWKAVFPLTKEVQEIIKDRTGTKLIPLYWLTAKKTSDESCDKLLNSYDYANAVYLASTLKGFDSTKMQLVSVHQKAFLTMDISKATSRENLTTAFDVWREELSRQPETNSSINPYNILASARDVLGALSSLLSLKKNL